MGRFLNLPGGVSQIELLDHVCKDYVFVFGIETDVNMHRNEVREKIRNVSRVIIGRILDCNPEEIELVSESGRSMRLKNENESAGLSISHEAGLSLLAINMHGAVGVDLILLDENFDWENDYASVSIDYLGAEKFNSIENNPDQYKNMFFSYAWTEMEAELKCLEIGICEWSEKIGEARKKCLSISLNLDGGMVGTVSILT